MNYRLSLLQKNKPTHQFHDKKSLLWISSHRPDFCVSNYKIPNDIMRSIDIVKPWKVCRDAWFTDSLIRDGIHGFRHVVRVAINGILIALARNSSLSVQEIRAIVFAGLLHDCRRINDNSDSKHGVRAALWLKRNSNILPKGLLHFLRPITFAISVHNYDYGVVTRRKLYKKYQNITDIIKTADAMDRYRFPRLDWWFSKSFVTVQPNIQELSFAFDLALHSEEHYVSKKNNRASIIETWNTIKRNH